MRHEISRRRLLLGSGTLFAWAHMPAIAREGVRDPRLLVVVLRGALDGLAMVAPIGDPEWGQLRGDKALTLEGGTPALRLDSFFALNPAMPNLHRLYMSGQATFLHATATPYRERSHFDGQDVLESGLPRPGRYDSGWLNRALTNMRPAGRVDPEGSRAFAVGPVTPLVVRGPAPVLAWSPSRLAPASDDTAMRLLHLFKETDPALAAALESRLHLDAMSGADGRSSGKPQGANQLRDQFAEAAGAAGRYLAAPEGPRVGALALNGWDTHINDGVFSGKLATLLGALDHAMGAVEASMGQAWHETVVVLVTEFGRTARINGNGGTDHGTATVAVLAGGAVKGGRVIADWPGLRAADLHEARDLKPTTDLRAVLKGVLEEHLQVDSKTLAGLVFPGSENIPSMKGLLRAA